MLLRRFAMPLVLILVCCTSLQAQNAEKKLKEVAEKFVKAADIQDAGMLEEVLHPESQQFVSMGPRLIKSPADQYIAAIKAKKLGGEPRTITFKNVDFIGDNTALTVLNAKSSKFDFSYQLSMAKSEGKWMIVGILTEAKPLN